MSQSVPAGTYPNVGTGPDPFSFETAAADPDTDFLLVLLQRDYYCTNCRKQVRAVADRYDAFADRATEVVSIVPDPPAQVETWQAQYDLPFPLLADPEATVGDTYDQPVRFGFLGQWSDFLGRMPEAVLIDVREDPEIVWTHRGSSTYDRPEVTDFLDRIDEFR